MVATFLSRFFDKFSRDETTTLAASLAFYTALSMAPLLILFVAVAARLSDQLLSEFLINTESLVGAEAAEAVRIVIEGARSRTDLTSIAGLLGLATLLVSASLIFGQLRTALNRIFNVQAPDTSQAGYLHMAWQFLRERVTHILFALIGIVCLVLTLMASSFLSATFQEEAGRRAMLANVAVSFVFYVLFFTAVFRYLPDKRQPWRSALGGGLLTAVFFEIGKEILGLYLGKSAIGSAYGAAGSLIVLLVWVYYSTLITFIGAQISSILMPGSARPRAV